MSALPRGWAEATIRDVLELKYGKSLPEKSRVPGGYSVYGSNGVVGSHTEPVTRAPTIIVGRKGSIGEVHYSEDPCFPIDTTYFVDDFDAIDPPFAAYLLHSLPLREMNRASAIPGLNREDAYGVSIALPPLPEQRRIVEKIDSLTGKSKRARDHLDHIPRLVEKYKQAILAAAFRGALTREWREEMGFSSETQPLAGMPREIDGRSLPVTWSPSTIAHAAINHDGKRIPVRASDRAMRHGAYPYYGASGIIDYIDDYLFDGDFLLIGEDGANLVSRSTPIAFLASGQFWVNNHAHILQAKAETSNAWLSRFVNMIDLVPYVTGSAQPKLTQAALNRIGIPLPPLQEQSEILRRIESAFNWIDRLAAEATGARKLIDHLDQAILTKAFRGELVPQDPADEPASVLLERIRTERAAAPKPKRGRKKAA